MEKDKFDLLRDQILKAGISEVHRITGLSRGRLTDFVTKKSGMNSESLIKIMDFLGVELTNSPNVSKDPNLDIIVKFVLKHYSPKKIILFGSRARGDFNDESDYDIFILMDEYDGDIYVKKFEDKLSLPVDFIVDKSVNKNSALYSELKKDGKVLYERKP